jgi:hypothetical protein
MFVTEPNTESNLEQPKISEVINQRVVVKGSLLGGVLLGLFMLGAVVIYLLTGLLGWDGLTARVLLAMCIGPFLGLSIFGVWMLYQRQGAQPKP